MYSGLNRKLVSLLRCSEDGEPLKVAAVEEEVAGALVRGSLCCTACGRRFEVLDGIVLLRVEGDVHEESRREERQRDRDAHEASSDWGEDRASHSELVATLAALQASRKTILELGCGRGRFTKRIAGEAASVVAVDFSLQSLRRLAARLQPEDPVVLVCADVTHLQVAPGIFDRVLATLASNLPTAAHREGVNRLAATALRTDGCFVSTGHYFGLRQRLKGEKKEGHYRNGGIYRRLFGLREMRAEAARHFDEVSCRRIQVLVPFLGRIPAVSYPLARIGEHLPFVNLFAELLLVTARRPRVGC